MTAIQALTRRILKILNLSEILPVCQLQLPVTNTGIWLGSEGCIKLIAICGKFPWLPMEIGKLACGIWTNLLWKPVVPTY